MNPVTALGKLIPESIKCGGRDQLIIDFVEDSLDGEKSLLDCGCGTGRLGKRLQEQLDLKVYGVDVRFPKTPLIPFKQYDGKTIPFKDNSFDAVLLSDVLHHTNDPDAMLAEVLRVAKKSVFIKDHYYKNFLDLQWLKFYDFMGNVADGTPTPFTFYSLKKWQDVGKKHNAKIEWWRDATGCPQVLIKLKA